MWRGLIVGVLGCVAAGPALGQSPLLVREGGFQHASQSLDRQAYPYADGAFFAYEDSLTDAQRAAEGQSDRRPQQVVAIDARTGAARPVTPPLTKPLNIEAALKDHLVSVGGDYNRVSIIRRRDGAVLGEKRLNERVYDALIEGDTVYLLQEMTLSRFRLPGMTFLGETRLPDAYHPALAKFVDRKLVAANAERIDILSLSGAALGSIPLTQPCTLAAQDVRHELAVSGHYVVARTGCRRVTVFDVREGKRIFDLPEYAERDQLSIAIGDRFIYVRSLSSTRPSPISVFELASGRELARVALPAGKLNTLGDRLVVSSIDALAVPRIPLPRDRRIAEGIVGQVVDRRLTVSVYRPDLERLLDPRRAEADLHAAIVSAKATDNPYSAYDRLEAASPQPMVQWLRSGKVGPWRDDALYYARTLSLGQTHVAEGVAMLERLSSIYPGDATIQASLLAATERAAILDSDPSIREPTLTRLWKAADKRPLLTSRIAAQRATGELDWDAAQIHDNQIFVPCRDCPDKGTGGIQVFDRKSLRPAGVLSAPAGMFGTVEINSIVFSGGRMFAGLNRSAGSDEPNVVAYDLASMSEVSAWDAVDIGTERSSLLHLAVRNGVVGAYDCNEAGSANGFLVATLEQAPPPLTNGDVCDYRSWQVPSLAPELSPELAARAKAVDARIGFAGRKYLVGTQGNAYIKIEDKLFLREGDTQGIALPRAILKSAGGPDIAFTSDEDVAVTATFGPESVTYTAFDIEARRDFPLIDIRVGYPRSIMATDGRTLFAGFGSSLLAIDMRTGDVLDFADVFSAASGEAPIPTSPIVAVRLDGDRIVVGSALGLAAFDLNVFYAAADAKKNPFAETRRILLN